MFGKASARESKAPIKIEGIVSVRVKQWERLRDILSRRYNYIVDDKTIMMYVLQQGGLVKGECKYGIFFDIDGEHVILEV